MNEPSNPSSPTGRFSDLDTRLQAAIASVAASTHVDAQTRTALIDSLKALQRSLSSLAKTPAQGESLVQAAESVAREAVRTRPDRPLMESSLQALHEAAQSLKEHEPGILDIVRRFALALSDIGI